MNYYTDAEFNIEQSRFQDPSIIEQLRRERQSQRLLILTTVVSPKLYFNVAAEPCVEGTISEVPDDPR